MAARKWRLTLRDRNQNASMLVEAVLLGLLLGGAFWKSTDAKQVLGLLFYLASVLLRQAWQVIPIVFQEREVWYKQRELGFHRACPTMSPPEETRRFSRGALLRTMRAN